LQHPVLREAPQSSCRVTLEATLAWAEAESGDETAAQQRIGRLLRELADADQPLVIGFVHENAARIAHRAADESAREEHLANMKRWYSATRNAALLMRAQRVIEGLSEPKAPSPRAAGETEREIVTRVTTRREITSVEGLFEGSTTREELCHHALHFLVDSANGDTGFLYLQADDGVQLCAATAGEPDEDVEGAIHELLSRPCTAQNNDLMEVAPLSLTSELDGVATQRGLFLLFVAGRELPLGAALVCSREHQLRAVPAELLHSIAKSLARCN
jgi:hypothetical protein